MPILKASFLISNTDYHKCPADGRPEFAFIGRSNVGKSTLINMICRSKDLAKTSSKPGKTQLINHFSINDKQWYLVDLPGYGYAKTSKTARSAFEDMISGYLLNREPLLNTFILIDARLEPQKIDLEFIDWMGENSIPFSLILTKIDKISKAQVQRNRELLEEVLSQTWEELPEILMSSAVKIQGREEIVAQIDTILSAHA